MSTPADLEELGRRIRKLRIERRLTLKQVETASGLSSTHLSEIERGRTSPTIGALIRIARALGKRPSFFIEPEELGEVVVVPAGTAPSWTPTPRVTVHALTPGIPGSELFSYRVEFADGTGDWSPGAPTPGHAIYYVVRGAVRVWIGDDEASLAAGDAIEGPLSLAHRFRGTGDGAGEILAILTGSITPAA